MKIPNPYFEDIPKYGNLVMEQIIVDYVYPLLSVLKDGSGNRYICMCFDTRESQRWIVAPVSVSILIKLLTNKVTLDYPFKNSRDKIVFASRNYSERKDSFRLLAPSEVATECLPEPGEYLDSETGEWEDYIAELNTLECSWIEDSTETEFFCNSVSSAIIPLVICRTRLFHDVTETNHYSYASKMNNMRYAVAY